MPRIFPARIIIPALASLALSACAQEAAPRTLRSDAADTALHELWLTALPAAAHDTPPKDRREWQMQLTTWLPSEWPPTPRTVWTRYAYGLDVTLDGIAGVSAPFARLERGSGDDPNRVLVPMARKVKAVATQPVRPHGGWNYTLDDEKRILAQALALTAALPPEARGTPGLIAYYKSWRLGHAEIAALVQPRHRAFFAWLASQ